MLNVFGFARYEPEHGDAPAYSVDIPDLELSTQGESLDDALFMAEDMVRLMFEDAGIDDVSVQWQDKDAGVFSVGSLDVAGMLAFIMRQKRGKEGVTLHQLSERLGFASHNSIAAYEQATRSPSVEKLSEIAEGLGYDLVISLKKKAI